MLCVWYIWDWLFELIGIDGEFVVFGYLWFVCSYDDFDVFDVYVVFVGVYGLLL